MNDNILKNQLLNNYLKQQSMNNNLNTNINGFHSTTTQSVISNDDNNAIILYNDAENISLEEFKNYVRKWFEYDNFIKKAKEIIKEKTKQRDKLTDIISKFMCKYDIEDLNTKDGKIRCKKNVVKLPINQKIIKERINDYFKDENQKKEIMNKIYNDERKTIEKVSLRRLKIVNS